MNRSTADVFEDHLELARQGDIETDVQRNFFRECVLLTSFGRFSGHEGVREAAELLERQVPHANYEYVRRETHGEIAFLEWTADSETARVRDGADSFLIRDGRILTMTIHYTVEPC